jgi:quinolinate synthase
MLLWQGACIVHDEFKGVELELLKKEHPKAKVLVHPESPRSVVQLADVVGSTTQLINAVKSLDAREFIVATDNGIFHKMRQAANDAGKRIIEAPTAGNGATCKSCAHCPWMAMNGLAGLARVLETGESAPGVSAQVHVDAEIGRKAHRAIDRMLAFAAQANAPKPSIANYGETYKQGMGPA